MAANPCFGAVSFRFNLISLIMAGLYFIQNFRVGRDSNLDFLNEGTEERPAEKGFLWVHILRVQTFSYNNKISRSSSLMN